jgi:hypothetical protein
MAGLFIALQNKIIACVTKKMLLSLRIRFFLGPALMVISSYAIGMRGTLLQVAIMQVHSRILVISTVSSSSLLLPMSKKNMMLDLSKFYTDSSTSRNSAICVCERVQCARGHCEHCLSTSLLIKMLIFCEASEQTNRDPSCLIG